LESFFSELRGGGGGNRNPTASTFEGGLAAVRSAKSAQMANRKWQGTEDEDINVVCDRLRRVDSRKVKRPTVPITAWVPITVETEEEASRRWLQMCSIKIVLVVLRKEKKVQRGRVIQCGFGGHTESDLDQIIGTVIGYAYPKMR
jgi:hypothetical protein